MTDKGMQSDDRVLEALFERARRTAPSMDAAFLERLASDMESQVPAPKSGASQTVERPGFFRIFLGIFAASGLTGAAALGVWIGFVMPDTLTNLAVGYDTSEPFGIGAFLPAADLVALEE